MRHFRYVILALALIGGLVWLQTRDSIARTPAGPASNCRGVPAFVNQYGFTQPTFDTSHRDKPGLLLVDNADRSKNPIQQPSWKQFGNLGPLTRDKNGAIYTVTIPLINTNSVPSDAHLAILRLDPQTGVLQKWMNVNGPGPTSTNYYGLTSLAYDCGTQLLYVAGLAGSSQGKENGFIVAIDPATKREKFRYEGVDVLGMEVYGSAHGRYLYVGSARVSRIMRIGLTAAGKPFGRPEFVLQFDDFNRTRANKILFTWGEMQIHTTEFYYNLIASTEFDQQTLTYSYDQNTDKFIKAAGH